VLKQWVEELKIHGPRKLSRKWYWFECTCW